MIRANVLMLLTIPLLFPGCADTLTLPDLPGFLARENAPGNAGALEYYEWTRSADSEELRAELIRLRSQSDLATNPVSAVQLSLINTTIEPDSMQILEESVSILGSMGRDCHFERCKSYVRFGTILNALLDARQQLGLTLADNAEEVTALNAKISALEAQIEAITNIEQQLIERDLPENRR